MERTILCRIALLAMIPAGLSACSSTKAPGVTPKSPAPGRCGGFEKLALATSELPLLEDRLRMRAIAGLAPSPRPTDIMAPPPNQKTETRLFLADGDRKLVVMSEELFATPGTSLAEAVRSQPLLQNARVEEVRLESGLRVALATEKPIDATGEAIPIAHAFTVLADDTVQVTRVFVNPAVARAGSDGCAALAEAMFRTLAPGMRKLDRFVGDTALGKDHHVTLLAPFTISRDDGPDFEVYRLISLEPLGAPPKQIGIYMGDHPDFRPEIGAKQVPARILGESTNWYETSRGQVVERQALVGSAERGFVHIFLFAPTSAAAKSLSGIAESLRAATK